MTSSSGVEALVSELLSDVTFGGVVYAVAAASGSRVAAAALYHAASCIGLAVSATFGATLDAPMLAVLYASVLIPLGADAWAILMAACAGSSCCSDGMSAPSFGFGGSGVRAAAVAGRIRGDASHLCALGGIWPV